ncbi:putative benzoate 4-monooxygenase cytochrome P450 [Xylogone sp. PMI_703]|nr:putative benzoate 4-monooxygenase cytochrome P450 [Xylogone sp. PMI_703]
MDVVLNLSLPWKIAGSVVLLLFLRITYGTFTNRLSSLPGPQISKWTSIVLTYHWLAGTRVNYVHSLHQKYGPVVRVSPDEVDICDIKTAREIHKVGGRFPKSYFYRTLGPPANPNLFTATDPKFHANRRRLLAPFFAESSIADLEPVVLDRVRTAMKKILEDFKNHGVVDMYKWWVLMAIDIMGELSFGEPFQLLELGKKNQYATHISMGQRSHPIRTTFPTLIRIAMTLPLPVFKAAARIGPEVFQYAMSCVTRYKEHLDSNPDPKKILLTKLFDKGKEGLTELDIVFEAQSYITAGTDTTSTTLTYLVYAVCSNEEIRDKLTAELEPLSETLMHKDVKDLPYLNKVIDETLRLYTAAPSALPRVVPPEGAQLAGRHIPGGATVSTQLYSLHRDKVFTNPETFDPSRWDNPTKDMQDAFMPFSTGSRGCIGIHLARMELRLATAYFFKTFPHAKMSPKGTPEIDMEPQTFFLLAPKGHRCLVEI